MHLQFPAKVKNFYQFFNKRHMFLEANFNDFINIIIVIMKIIK